jgi:hypothetical protein
MNTKFTKTHLAYALILGSVWGFAEVALGAGIKACAHQVSGSLMTGLALFFITLSWSASRNILTPLLVILIASVFKLFDAVLLSLPVMHGAIGNPIFAFLLEGFAFILLVSVFGTRDWTKRRSGALLGAGSALVAVCMFPLVKFATGVPACVYGNTAIPLSIFFGPIAIAVSAVTVPMGISASPWFKGLNSSPVRYITSPLTMVLCLALVFLFRLIVI